MITRAYIEEIDYDNARVKVRIPLLNGVVNSKYSTPPSQLSWAKIIIIPGIEVQYNVGDVVFVGFEDNDVSYPVVLGYMMTTKESRVNKDLKVTLTATSLKVKDSAELPSNLTFVSPNQERKILSFENIWSKVEDKQ